MILARPVVPGAMVRDLFWTCMTSLASGLALVLVTRLLAQGLGPDDFGVYSVTKRLLAIVGTVSTLGMAVALARHVATASDDNGALTWVLAGTIIVAPAVLVVAVGVLAIDRLAAPLLGDARHLGIVTAALALLTGQSCFTLLYGYYRGSGRMGRANLWQFGVAALAPVVIAATLAQPGRVALVLMAGACVYLATALPLAMSLKRAASVSLRTSVVANLKTLLAYGVPRVPGALGLTAMFAIGPLLAASSLSVRDSGHVVIGQAVFALAEMLLAGFGLVALPRAARMVQHGRNTALRERITDVFGLSVYLGAFVVIHLCIWADEIVGWWLGAEYLAAVPVFRMFLLGLLPYIWYSLLRSILDAIDVRAVNTRNVLAGCAVTLLLSAGAAAWHLGAVGLAGATAAGLSVVGALTVGSLVRRGKLSLGVAKCQPWMWLNAAFGAVALALKLNVPSASIPVVVLGEAALVGGYCLALRWLGISFVAALGRRATARAV